MLNFMTERQDIADAIARMPSKLGAKKELKALPDELWEGETVEVIASGTYSDGVGILVATDRRLLFLFKGLIRSISEDFAYARISSIEYKGGMAFASVIVYVSNQKAEIKNLTKGEAKMIVDLARNRMNNPRPPEPVSASVPVVESPADQLLKLKQLHDAGVLTDEQYAEKTAPLIAEL